MTKTQKEGKLFTPPEFDEFCRGIHQDIDLVYELPEQLIHDCLRRVDKQQWHIIWEFLGELLNGDNDHDDIHTVWHSTPAEICFPNDKELVQFLRLLMRTINQQHWTDGSQRKPHMNSASTTSIPPLPDFLTDQAVRRALAEDLGDAGDITTAATVPAAARARVALRARASGRVAGLYAARAAFRLVDPALAVTIEKDDGADLEPGDTIAVIEGSARAILTAERVALNFLGHLSGIATVTRAIARSIAGTKAKVCCTRKTTPGLRAFEKHAVTLGGGVNHRFGLYDAILIKDNHIAIAGGIDKALAAVRDRAGHMVKVEIEVDTLDQLKTALQYPIDAVLLDNMTPDRLREAVALIAGRVTAEASGGITADTAPAVAATGVDLLSVGWITHSAPCLDIGLDFES